MLNVLLLIGGLRVYRLPHSRGFHQPNQQLLCQEPAKYGHLWPQLRLTDRQSGSGVRTVRTFPNRSIAAQGHPATLLVSPVLPLAGQS
jgi:hypothetical protein